MFIFNYIESRFSGCEKFVSAFFLVFILVQTTLSQDFLQRGWDLEEGMPSTTVFAIARTHDGYFWLGTAKGLARFDGLHFVTYTKENTPSIKNNLITCLAVDWEGVLWIGSAGGTLVKYKQGQFTSVALTNLTGRAGINSIQADARGNIWLGTSGIGIICLKEGAEMNISITNGLDSNYISQLQADAQGRIWYLSAQGNVGWVDGGRVFNLHLPTEWTDSVQFISLARQGGLWLAIYKNNTGSKILRFQDGRVTEDMKNYPWSQGFQRARVSALLEDMEGQLWCGTSGEGVYLLDSKRHWLKPIDKLPLSQANVRCLFQDYPGSILIGTRKSGLHQILPQLLSIKHLPPEFAERLILTVCVSHDGGIWVGTDGAGIFRWAGSKVDHFSKELGKMREEVYALLEDSKSNLWVGTSSGLLQFHNERFEPVSLPALSGKIAVLYEDKQNQLWAGTSHGLVGIGDNTKVIDERDGLPNGQIVSAIQGSDGRFWITVEDHGIYEQKDGRFELWKSKAGRVLPLPHRDDGMAVQPLLDDYDGSVWVGTYGHGLFRLDDGQESLWNMESYGLPSNHLISLQRDAASNLWCSSENGIFCCNQSSLNQVKFNSGDGMSLIRITRLEGLPYKVCSGSGQPTSTKTPDGKIWFPDGPALVSFNPSTFKFNDRVLPPVIEEMLVDASPVPPSIGHPVKIKWGATSFEFRFSSPNELNPSNLRFRCRLDGVDTKWGAEGTDRTIKYGKLAPGYYIFRVMVRNIDGAWSDTTTALPFYIVPNWWNTNWFYTLVVGCFFVVLAFTFWQLGQVRSRRKLSVLERSRSIEQERNRIARDIHDDLGANLTQVTLLSKMVSDPLTSEEELRTKSQQIAKTTKSMVQSLETIVWAVRPENDSLRSLVEYLHRRTDELFENLSIRHRFTVQGNLPALTLYAELRHNIYLAYREVLTNALKHSGATLISVEISIKDYGCHIVIADNGKGIKTDLVRSGGSGLKNIRLRMDRTGGRCEWQTESGQGTTVKLYFPLPLSLPN